MKKIRTLILLVGAMSSLLFSTGFVYGETSNLDSLKEAARLRAQQSAQNVKEAREKAQADIKQLKTNVQERVKQIKDKTKQTAADRIVKQLDHVNVVWTDHFTNVLDRLDEILQKVKTRMAKAKTNDKDVTSVTAAIGKAEMAIANARTAVANQARKTYTVETLSVNTSTSEENQQKNLMAGFREQFKTLHKQLRSDLTTLRDGVIKDTREAVRAAFKALSGIPNVDKEPSNANPNQ